MITENHFFPLQVSTRRFCETLRRRPTEVRTAVRRVQGAEGVAATFRRFLCARDREHPIADQAHQFGRGRR